MTLRALFERVVSGLGTVFSTIAFEYGVLVDERESIHEVPVATDEEWDQWLRELTR